MQINKLTSLYEYYASNGYTEEIGHDNLRKIRTVNSVGFILILALFTFVILEILVFNRPLLALIELIALVISMVFIKIQKSIKDLNLICNISVGMIVFGLIAINFTTTINNTSTYWFFLAPLFAFYVSGLRSGVKWSMVLFGWLFVFSLLSLFKIYGPTITFEYATDILMSYVVITIISFFYEYARLEATSDLTTTNDEMRRLIYIVSHDLRTPLTALRGYSALLKEDITAQDKTDISVDIERIELMANNMGKMIDDLLNLSRIGRHSDEKAVVNIRDLVDLIIKENEPRLLERKIRVEVVEPLPRILVNQRKLEEVMRNLVSNAIKYMGPSKDPLIKLGAVDRADEYNFYVLDHGIGIDRKDYDKLFNLFSRLTTIAEGSGIGLSIVKGFVLDMGGRVWIESEVGRGSTFWFSIPKEETPQEII